MRDFLFSGCIGILIVVEANKIRLVDLTQQFSLVLNQQVSLGHEWNVLKFEFFFEALLIDGLQKTTAHLAIDFKDRSLDRVTFIFVKETFVRQATTSTGRLSI